MAIQNQINQNKGPVKKKHKIEEETVTEKGHKLQYNFNNDILDDLQDINKNPLDRCTGAHFSFATCYHN